MFMSEYDAVVGVYAMGRETVRAYLLERVSRCGTVLVDIQRQATEVEKNNGFPVLGAL